LYVNWRKHGKDSKSKFKRVTKKIENDLMKDDLTSDVIIAKAKLLEVILKELRWED